MFFRPTFQTWTVHKSGKRWKKKLRQRKRTFVGKVFFSSVTSFAHNQRLKNGSIKHTPLSQNAIDIFIRTIFEQFFVIYSLYLLYIKLKTHVFRVVHWFTKRMKNKQIGNALQKLESVTERSAIEIDENKWKKKTVWNWNEND